ncbi:MAG: energy transducer TonB [Planctomycetota bacterium]
MSAPGSAAARRPGRWDLPACALAALGLHAALLGWLPPPVDRPAVLAARAGNISVEVSLASQRPATVDSLFAPEIEVREPEPLERPREKPVELPAEDPSEPDIRVRPELPIDVPEPPRELIEPPETPRPPAPASVCSGVSGNRRASIARHYIRHPDDRRRQRPREGAALLRIQVLASGRVGQVTVLKSSGHEDLDLAAIRGLRRARCEPASRGGKPVDSFIEKRVHFVARGKATAD